MEELRRDLALYPTWFPFDAIELGAFGTLQRGRFVRAGRLRDLGIAIEPKRARSDGNLHKSRGFRFTASSTATGQSGLVDASLGVKVHVEREHAWVFAARGISSVTIDNIAEVRREILEASRRGAWERSWLLVTEYRHVDQLNVVVARSRKAEAEVTAKGTLAAADVLLGEDVKMTLEADDVFKVLNQKDSTPLYSLAKLRGWLRPGLESTPSGDDEHELSVERTDDEPFGFE
jgi:hypothetical protein